MNKHLNNWMDEAEGKKKGSSNAGIKKEMVRQGYKKEMAKKMVHKMPGKLIQTSNEMTSRGKVKMGFYEDKKGNVTARRIK